MKTEKKSYGKKKAIIFSSVCIGLAVFVLLWLMFCGYMWSWGPFHMFANHRFKGYEGNDGKYAVANVEKLEESPLEGYNILYLGSSVTNGAVSLQTSFPEYIAKRNNTTFTKEAVNGTTLVDGGNFYISRLKKLDTSVKYDLFICQLSTNDSSQNKRLGEVSASDATEYDTATVCGAIEYIINYVEQTWNCPVVFYTNAYYESDNYAAMVNALIEIGQKYDIGIIDLYSDKDFNNITDEQRKLYMADRVHPTQAGYLEWWTPKMEEYLYGFVGQ